MAETDPLLKKMLIAYFQLAALPNPNPKQKKRIELLETSIKKRTND
jgi:hypothetical protein